MDFQESNQLRFRVVEQEVLSDIISWVIPKLNSGYDICWEKRFGFEVWVIVPGNTESLLEFLERWGNYVLGEK